MRNDVLNNFKLQAFTVLEPVQKELSDITDEYIERLDNASAVSLAIQLKESLVEVTSVVMEMETKQVSMTPAIHEVIVDNNHESNVVKTVEDYNIINSPNVIHRPKRFMTYNKWTDELRESLKRSALKGKSISEIHTESQKHGLHFTKDAIKSQLRLMGFSIKKDVPTLKENQ